MLLSVIVTITDGEPHLDRCLQAITTQRDAPALEIIVPVYPAIEPVALLRQHWPRVRFIEIANTPPAARSLAHWLYDQRRGAGLHAATGDLIAMTEDHAIPEPGWCAKIVEAHRAPHAAIGGAIEYAGRRALNRAVYFCDFGRYHRDFPAGSAEYISDINVSYKRAALMQCSSVWRDFYHETAVHGSLRQAGETLWLTPDFAVWHDRGRLQLSSLLPERFYWARVFAGRRAQTMTIVQRAVYAALAPALPGLLLARKLRQAARNPASIIPFLLCTPLLLLVTCMSAFGEMTGYITARSFAHDPVPSSRRTTALAERSAEPVQCASLWDKFSSRGHGE